MLFKLNFKCQLRILKHNNLPWLEENFKYVTLFKMKSNSVNLGVKAKGKLSVEKQILDALKK